MLEKRPGKVEHPAWFQVCDRLRSEKYGQSLSLRCVGLCLTNSLPYRWLPLYHGRAKSWKSSISGAFCVIGNCVAMFLLHKKRSAQDRTAAEWNHVAKATRRRRRILQKQDPFLCFVLKCLLGRTPFYSNICSNLWIKKKRPSYLERSDPNVRKKARQSRAPCLVSGM